MEPITITLYALGALVGLGALYFGISKLMGGSSDISGVNSVEEQSASLEKEAAYMLLEPAVSQNLLDLWDAKALYEELYDEDIEQLADIMQHNHFKEFQARIQAANMFDEPSENVRQVVLEILKKKQGPYHAFEPEI